MREALEAPDLPPRARRTLLFLLAELVETVGAPRAAFEHLRQAQALSTKPYDVGSEVAYVEHLAALFTPQLLAARKDEGDPTPQMIFVIGMPRSGAAHPTPPHSPNLWNASASEPAASPVPPGTTLVERMLSAHKEVRKIALAQ